MPTKYAHESIILDVSKYERGVELSCGKAQLLREMDLHNFQDLANSKQSLRQRRQLFAESLYFTPSVSSPACPRPLMTSPRPPIPIADGS